MSVESDLAAQYAAAHKRLNPAAGPTFSTGTFKHVFIVDYVGFRTGITPEQIYGKSHEKQVMLARRLCYLLIYRMTLFSLPQVGRVLGGRDHSSVWKGIASILAQSKRDPQPKRFIFDLCRELREKGLLHQKEQEA